jgi:hypothetical protein
MGSSGGGGTSSNTVTQVQQIPAYEQQFSQQNQALAQSLGSQPYPTYGGSLVAGFTPLQNQAIGAVPGAATAYQPLMGAAEASAGAAGSINPLALNPADPNTVAQYMNPYVQNALAPQIHQLQTQLGQQQMATNAQATAANAFGDARQGVQNSLNNYYGNLSLNDLLGQGYNTAYTNAMNTIGQQQQMGLGEQQAMNAISQNLGNLAGQNQQLGLTGANAVYNAGQLQQQLSQQGLNAAYQQYLNQVNWPYQMLNVQESALSNSPYNITNYQTLPNANMTAQGLGTFASLAGAAGSLLGGQGSTQNPTAPLPFG